LPLDPSQTSSPTSDIPHATPDTQPPTPDTQHPTPVVAVDRLRMVFESRGQEVVALDDFTVEVHAGEFLTIVGPSGCGKSTVLNAIAGLLAPSAGAIKYKGQTTRGINTEIGYVTQEDNLFPWRTLRGNVEYGMEVRGFPASERRETARRLIAEVGLDGFEQHYRHELSGGMRQRVNIIRTLSYEPEVILMDEPFGPLDAQTRLNLQNQLLALWQERPGTTIVFITHDLSEAIALADRVVVMTKRPGRIKAIYPVELPRPRDIFKVQVLPEFRALYENVWQVLQDEMREDSYDRQD
jgi:NitT/TauT family transport system ATP-binding protein